MATNRCLLMFIVLLVLVGCMATAPGAPLPAYVVILTPSMPLQHGRCTGVVLDTHHVLTAHHCLEELPLDRVMTQFGQEARLTALHRWPEIDAVIAQTNLPLLLPAYATFAPPDTEQPAELFGGCEHFLLHVPRRIHFVRESAIKAGGDGQVRRTQQWRSLDLRLCGGDSGGPAIQNGQVVGFTHALLSDVPWVPYGSQLYLVPSTEFAELLAQTKRSVLAQHR